MVHEGLLLLQYGLLLGCSMLGSLGHAGHLLLQNAVARPYERDLLLGTPRACHALHILAVSRMLWVPHAVGCVGCKWDDACNVQMGGEGGEALRHVPCL